MRSVSQVWRATQLVSKASPGVIMVEPPRLSALIMF